MTQRQLDMRKFVAPEFIFGIGAMQSIGPYAKKTGKEKALLVSDPGVINAGWTKEVEKALTEAGIKYCNYNNVTPNPKDFEVMEGAEVYKSENCGLIISVGGGSPTDCAKAIGIVSANGKDINEFEGIDKVFSPCPPLICIPTTAGSAADVSQYAIITNTRKRVKIAIMDRSNVPLLSLIDPNLTLTMDEELTAMTGMDALTHAIEAYVSKESSFMTDMTSIEAIKLISENLLSAVRSPKEIKYRTLMMRASLLAGLAFSNAGLGIIHGMAHALGGKNDMAHGIANSILLDKVIAYNFDSEPERYCEIAKAMGIYTRGMSDQMVSDYIGEKIYNMVKAVGLNQSLSKFGISTGDIQELAMKAMNDPCLATNPKKTTVEDLEMLFKKAM